MNRSAGFCLVLCSLAGALVSSGILSPGSTAAAEAGGSKPQPPMVPENLALGKPATASSTQRPDLAPGAAVDGNFETRWCAADNRDGYWWQVDLGKPEDLTGCRLTWEHDGARYRYKVEGSSDGKAWTMLADRTRTEEREQEQELAFQARSVRYLRVTATDVEDSHWASLLEFEAFGTRKVPAPSAGPARPVRLKTAGSGKLLGEIKAPAGFAVTIFAQPPEVHYPTCLAAAPTGEVYVGIDENGSIDAKPDRGRVLRCVDADGDGKADRFDVFARMDSPRGLIVDGRTVYVLHPPSLSAYHDDDGDGVSDRSEVLVRGIGFTLKQRGADHTTNGIRLGIDGWIYIAVGDYGFIKAEGRDGHPLQLRGGGVARVRPDGTGLEIYSRGQRNIYDVAVDPYLNVFTRDNTNDGGGWDVRLSHIIPTGHYGYPSLFRNFADEIVQPLADYGGGSPTGSLYVQEPGLPAEFSDTLYTCDWGRSVVYRHPLQAQGAGFAAEQQPFLKMPRPTDMDVDGRARIYVASWRDGGFTYDKPDVGYVIRVTYPGSEAPPFPDLVKGSDESLLEHLASESQVLRLAAQREILRRGAKPVFAEGLERLALSGKPLAARVAAIFTLRQLLGTLSVSPLAAMTGRAEIREYALRALADGRAPGDVPAAPFLSGLKDANPRVRLQAAVGLARLGRREAAAEIVPLMADEDPLVAHAAVNALVSLRATEAVLRVLSPSSPARLIAGAVRVLQGIHDAPTVEGLLGKLDSTSDAQVRRAALRALCRLRDREADYTGDWWGTRPDTSGPYYKPVRWSESGKIDEALRSELRRADPEMLRWLLTELGRDRLDFEETASRAVELARDDAGFRPTAVGLLNARPKLTADTVEFLGRLARSEAEPVAFRAQVMRALQRHVAQPDARDAFWRALAVVSAPGRLEGDLVGLWQDATRDERNAGRIDEFLKMAGGSDPGARNLGFAVLIPLEMNPKLSRGDRAKAQSALDRAWKSPETAAALLWAIGQTRSERHSLQVRAHLADERPDVRQAATAAARQLGLDRSSGGANRPDAVARLSFDQVVAGVNKEKGDAKLGEQLFQRQGCISCHTVSKDEALKGPYLGDVTARYNRSELAESILKPSAKIAQGFETQKFGTASGQVIEGFVVRESGDEVELRNSSGVVTVLPKSEIEERGKSAASVMPDGLAETLDVRELASIMAYLESLRKN